MTMEPDATEPMGSPTVVQHDLRSGARPNRSLPDRRLQQLGGAAAVGAGGLTALSFLPTGGPQWLATGASLLGVLLLIAAAVLLAKAFVGDRAPLGWAKVGGILLVIYSCWWLAPFLLVPLLSPGDAAIATTTALDATRTLLGLLAGIAIAARWPARGFNRWSMLLVVAADIVFQVAFLGAMTGSVALMTAMSLAWPLSVLALGIGHALAGRWLQRDSA